MAWGAVSFPPFCRIDNEDMYSRSRTSLEHTVRARKIFFVGQGCFHGPPTAFPTASFTRSMTSLRAASSRALCRGSLLGSQLDFARQDHAGDLCKSIVKRVRGVPKDPFSLVWLTMCEHGKVVLVFANGGRHRLLFLPLTHPLTRPALGYGDHFCRGRDRTLPTHPRRRVC